MAANDYKLLILPWAFSSDLQLTRVNSVAKYVELLQVLESLSECTGVMSTFLFVSYEAGLSRKSLASLVTYVLMGVLSRFEEIAFSDQP